MNDKNRLIIKKLKKGLIASCQPIPKGPLDKKEIILAMCKASINGGAKGLRIEGLKNVEFVKKKLDVPLIGIIKKNLRKYPIVITPFLKDIDNLHNAGADIIAFDATLRNRPFAINEMIERIHFHKKIAMADCSTTKEGINALENKADIISTTLSGYTSRKKPSKFPDFVLLKKLIKKSKLPIFAEGRFDTPQLFKKAISMGSHSVVVGTALNRIEIITNRFINES